MKSNKSNMQLDVLLEQMKELIDKKVLQRTDKYFNLELSYEPNIIKLDNSDVFHLLALAWSDSAVYNNVFENDNWKDTEEYLNICDSLGAYTKKAWELLHSNKNLTPKDFMEKFKIKEHIRPMIFATGSIEDCERALNILVEWNLNHIKPLTELQEDSKYDFIKVSRKKGEIESTRCMNGECIGGIMTRETAF